MIDFGGRFMTLLGTPLGPPPGALPGPPPGGGKSGPPGGGENSGNFPRGENPDFWPCGRFFGFREYTPDFGENGDFWHFSGFLRRTFTFKSPPGPRTCHTTVAPKNPDFGRKSRKIPKKKGEIFVPSGRVIKYPPKCTPPGARAPPGAPQGGPPGFRGGPLWDPPYPPP